MKVRFSKLKIEKSQIFSMSTLGALLFATSLWVYTSLNDNYATRVEVPLVVQLPENRSPESSLPSTVSILAEDSGWNLFNLMYFNQRKVCLIDLQNEATNNPVIEIEENTILKSLRNLVTVKAEDVYPEKITIRTGPVITKKVPIKSRLDVSPDDNFITAKSIRFIPDSITIRGNRKVLQDLKHWPTELKRYDGLNKSFSDEVLLKDSLSTIVETSDQKVTAIVEIQQEAEVVLSDVQLQILGENLAIGEYLSADKVDITIRGGVEELIALDLEELKAYVNLEEISRDHVLKPKISLPDNFQLVSVSPRYIYKYKSKKNLGQLN